MLFWIGVVLLIVGLATNNRKLAKAGAVCMLIAILLSILVIASVQRAWQ